MYCPSGDQLGKMAWDGPLVSWLILPVWVSYVYRSDVALLMAAIKASSRPLPGCQAKLSYFRMAYAAKALSLVGLLLSSSRDMLNRWARVLVLPEGMATCTR